MKMAPRRVIAPAEPQNTTSLAPDFRKEQAWSAEKTGEGIKRDDERKGRVLCVRGPRS